MTNRWLFLRWTLVVILVLVGSFIVWQLGGFQSAWRLDATKLTFFILFVLAITTCHCGRLSWELTNLLDSGNKNGLGKIETKLEHGWFAAGLCELLGYLGTIAGLIMVFTAFEAPSNYDPESIKKLITAIYPGFQTAFITTLTGLISGILLRFQCHNIYMGVREAG